MRFPRATRPNAAAFGVPRSWRERPALPQVRVATIGECGSNAKVAAEMGPVGGKGACEQAWPGARSGGWSRIGYRSTPTTTRAPQAPGPPQPSPRSLPTSAPSHILTLASAAIRDDNELSTNGERGSAESGPNSTALSLPDPLERILYDLRVTSPPMLARASATDQLGEQLILGAADAIDPGQAGQNVSV